MLKKLTIGSAYALYHVVVILSAVILLVGLFVMYRMGEETKQELRNGILVRAQNAALFVDPEEIRMLAGDESDLVRPEYIELKEKLIALREINPDVRFIYIMGYNGTNLFFYVDSEDPDSEDYSPPGQEYPEASSEELVGYFSNESYVLGPKEDRWGRWVSAMAPVIDDSTGNRVGVVGVDLSADAYETQLVYVRGTIMAISILIAALVFVLGLYIRKGMQHIYSLNQKNERLESTSSELEKIQRIVKIGKWRWVPRTGLMSCDETMHEIMGVAPDKKVTYPYLQLFLAPEDKMALDEALSRAMAEGATDFTVSYHIVRPDTRETLLVKSSCTIERDGNGEALSVTGTSQVIS